MGGRGTTRCCSAVALIAASWTLLTAQAKPSTPPSFFPLATVWKLELNTQLTVPPAYDGNVAFFSIADDRIVAYDLTTGQQRWIVSVHPVRQPAAGSGFVFVPEGNAVVARRQADGTVAWQVSLDGSLVVPPVWINGTLLIASATGTVRALQGTDGRELWALPLGTPVRAAPSLVGDRAYVSTADGRVVALNAASGEPVWERRLGGAPAEILALDDRLYVGAADNYLYCLLTKNGEIDWRWRTGGDVVGRPIGDERRVYFVALDNVLRALDRKSGGQQWMRPIPLRPTSGPVRAGGTLVIAGLSSTLRAYNIADGAAAGEIAAGSDVAAPPYVFADPGTGLPHLLFIAADIAKGATATLATRRWEPEATAVSPLPNLISMTPAAKSP